MVFQFLLAKEKKSLFFRCFHNIILAGITVLAFPVNTSAQCELVKEINQLNGLQSPTVQCLLQAKNGQLLIGENEGLKFLLDGKIHTVDLPNILSGRNCRSIVETERSYFIGFWNGGVYKCNKRFKTFEKIHDIGNEKIRKLKVWQKQILVGTDDGCWIIDINSSKANQLSFETASSPVNKFTVTDFFVIHKQVYVTTHNNGIYELPKGSSQLKIWIRQNGLNIFSAFVQNDSLILGSGNSYFKNEIARLENERYFKNRRNGFIFWSYVETPIGLLAASYGVNRLNGGIYHIAPNGKVEYMNDFMQIQDREILCLSYDSITSTMYVGSRNSGLLVYQINPSKKLIKQGDEPIQDVIKTDSNTYLVYPDKLLAIGSENGISVSRKELWDYVNNTTGLKFNYRPTFNQFTFNFIKNGNRAYLGTSLGVFLLDNKKFSFTINTRTNAIVELENESYSWGTYLPIVRHVDGKPVKEINSNDGTYFNLVDMYNIAERPVIVDKNSWVNYIVGDSIIAVNATYADKVSPIVSTAKVKNKVITVHQNGTVVCVEVSKSHRIDTVVSRKIYDDELPLLVASNGVETFVLTQYGYHKYLDLIWNRFTPYNWSHKPEIPTKVFADKKTISIAFTDKLIEYDLLNFANTRLSKFKTQYLIDTAINVLTEGSNKISITTNQRFKLRFNPENFYSDPSLRLKIISNVNGENATQYLMPNQWFDLAYINKGEWNISIQSEDLRTGETQTLNQFRLIAQNPIYFSWPFYTLVTIIVLAFIVLIFLYLGKVRDKKRIGILETEQQLNRFKIAAITGQMNPHFIFNCMNSIQNLILKNENDTALRYMGSFGKILRHSIDQVNCETVSLKDEVKFIEAYLKLETLRFTMQLNIKVEVDVSDYTLKKVQIPPLILQPIIENAFRHAFNGVDKPSLKISITESEGQVSIKIEDNGIGFSIDKVNESTSKGLWMVKERLRLSGLKNSFNVYTIASSGAIFEIVLIQQDKRDK